MCYYTQQHASIKEVTKRFKASVDDPDAFLVSDMVYNYFKIVCEYFYFEVKRFRRA